MAAIASCKMNLYFRAENLLDTDTMSKSDPYAVLFYSDGVSVKGEAGRTETIKDNLNPNFLKAVQVEYFFEQKQNFLLRIFDDDGKGVQGDDDLGSVKFQLSHVVGSRGSTLKLSLPKRGSVYVTAKEVSRAGRDTVRLSFFGKALKKMDFFGKSDPYFKLYRILPNKTLKLLYQAKHIDNTLDPVWPACPVLRVADLTTSDMREPTIRFECFDKDLISDDEMGFFDCSFAELIEAGQQKKCFKLRDAKQEFYGDIYVGHCEIHHVPTFVEMLAQGLQINLACSVDFTGSNGDPRNPRSLHFMDPTRPNQYVRALMSVGDILLEYDTDKQVATFGFGAQLPDGQVSHFFHLNFQPNPHVFGIQGVLDSYGAALRHVRLAGPTNFAPTIDAVRTTLAPQSTSYTILLIITDGEITDMDQTVRAIVECDNLPLSIIIVGVGNGCDFELMDQLDGDKQKLRSGHNQMKRDIVQFVPFRNFENAPPGALAAEVLREVPDQVVDWALHCGWRPPTAPAPSLHADPAAIAGAPRAAPAATTFRC